MPKHLVIVESPTKAKTISKFLGKDFIIESSFGHVRDLPKSKMGIDTEKDYAPSYVIPDKSKKKVTELKKKAAKADDVYFATDGDREGEAIAWHLSQILDFDPKNMKRIVFHEITKDAILKAVDHARNIDEKKVDAQQARRILDRLVGYELSPFLWRKVARGLSAGRVQSVVVRLIVEREREIKAFKPQEYWTVDSLFSKAKNDFAGVLGVINGKSLKKFDLANKEQVDQIMSDLDKADYSVSAIEKRELKKSPPAPFTTSTLQQDANRRFSFSAKQTMMLAQQLYEGIEAGDHGQVGLITYMRTDSLALSTKFTDEAKKYIEEEHSKDYSLAKARTFKTKSKGAQEAHEAIRPTSAFRTPDSLKGHLDNRQWKLYDLIWRRAVASQMTEAIFDATKIAIDASSSSLTKNSNRYSFKSTGSIIKFAGYTAVLGTSSKEEILPYLKQGDKVDLKDLSPNQHFTKPPARYSEAGLVKALEERGIGRPSTYAPTISTVIDRGYVEKEERRLKPKDIAFLVTDLLVKHFPNIVDYDFTANMENDLDNIADGDKKWVPVVDSFYKPFKKQLEMGEKNVDKKEITEEETDQVCDKCGKPMIIKMGRFGKFVACTGYPECKSTKQINEEGKTEEPEKTNEKCEKCGNPMVYKFGRFGKFMGCSNYPDCKNIKSVTKKTGVNCPGCKKGAIVEKRTKRGKIFFACDKYPDCDFALWQKPTGENCPDCKSLLVFAAKDKVKCSSKECKFEKEQKTKKEE